jgi:hypothetical protein
VVAVFDTHMEITAVDIIRAKSIPLADFERYVSIKSAILLSTLYFCIAPAIKKPAMKRKITGFAYANINFIL